MLYFSTFNLACGSTTEKGQIIETFEKWGKTFKVEFDISANKPLYFPDRVPVSVLHLTTGENSGHKFGIPSMSITKAGNFVFWKGAIWKTRV